MLTYGRCPDALFINGEKLLQQHNRWTIKRRILINKNMGWLIGLFGNLRGHCGYNDSRRKFVSRIILNNNNRTFTSLL